MKLVLFILFFVAAAYGQKGDLCAARMANESHQTASDYSAWAEVGLSLEHLRRWHQDLERMPSLNRFLATAASINQLVEFAGGANPRGYQQRWKERRNRWLLELKQYGSVDFQAMLRRIEPAIPPALESRFVGESINEGLRELDPHASIEPLSENEEWEDPKRSAVSLTFFEEGDKLIAFLTITEFHSHTVFDDVYAALKEIEKRKASGLIISVRGNRGGKLEVALDITGLLVGFNIFIGSTAPFGSTHWESHYTRHHKINYLPLVILIDETTGSAAETLAAVLQNKKRAHLLGERTFGKAVITMSGTTLGKKGPFEKLNLVTHHSKGFYVLPDRSSHQYHGVFPDYEFPGYPGKIDNAYRMDQFPNAFPNRFNPMPRPAPDRRVLDCIANRGRAELIFAREIRSNLPLNDYQLLKAVDLLRCLEEVN